MHAKHVKRKSSNTTINGPAYFNEELVFEREIRPLMEQIQAKRRELRDANQSGSFNEALATQKLTEIAPLEAKLMGERFKLHQQMLSVLTAEQKTKLEQSREQFKNNPGIMKGTDYRRINFRANLALNDFWMPAHMSSRLPRAPGARVI